MLRPIKFFASLVTVFLAVLFLLSRFDTHTILLQFRHLKLSEFILTCLSISISMMISTVRFGLINQNFGVVSSWRFFHKVNMLSTFYAIFAMPLIMQTVGRIQFGTQAARTSYAPITAFEKSVSFGLMLIIAGISSYAYFETAIFDQNFLYALAIMLSIICFVSLISIAAFFKREEHEKLVSALQLLRRLGLTQNLVLSILLQFFILSSYVLLAVQLMPDTSILLLYGAFSIVVLATAIPIGFGGYGVRETTAGAVFLSFGLPAEVGIAIGLIYSFTHLIMLGINIFISFSAQDNSTHNAIKSKEVNYSPLWLVTTIFALIFMCFQIRIPLLNGIITLNPADFIVLIIAINTLILAYIQSQIGHIWVNPMMWPGIICFALMISIGWFVGWINFGSNEWAFANRLLGLIAILSFLIFGASLKRHLTQTEHQLIFKIMMFTFITTGIAQMFISAPLPDSISIFFNWRSMLSGFIGDRNAFSFLGLILVALATSTFSHGKIHFPTQRITFIFIGIILAMVVISGSRTGWAGAAILTIFLFFHSRRGFLYSIISFSIFFILIYILVHISEYIPVNSSAFSARQITDTLKLSHLRFLTWTTGIDFFIENPFFGAGLGASIKKIDIVIHNLYIWVAGEMGLVGLFLCLPMSYAILSYAFHGLLKNPSIYQKSLLSFLLVFGAFSLTHDIIYQRILWFGIGYFMATRRNFDV